MTNPIKCAHCTGRHWTAREVQACSQFGPAHKWNPSVVKAARMEPEAQIASLNAIVNRWPLKTPREMIEATRSGRFAVRQDENEPFKFVRISRPKHGKKKDCIVLQTQHSDFYKDCVVMWPSGQTIVIDRRIDPLMLLVVCDPVTASIKYGQELGVCCSCGRELTDGRSIYYGIGPECEKSWPEIILRTNEANGPYRPGL